MIKSMTGYGRGRFQTKLARVEVELKSLNHRYFELVGKIPPEVAPFEEKLRRLINKKIKRGRVSVMIDFKERRKSKKVLLDGGLAKEYRNAFLRLARGLKLKERIGLETIISLPGVLEVVEEKRGRRSLWLPVERALREALDELDKEKRQEGRALYKDIEKRLFAINRSLNKVEAKAALLFKRMRKKFSGEDLASLLKERDISEEITRISYHLKNFKSSMLTKKGVGKHLDFIAQELHREANTMGAKATDPLISQEVIRIRTQLERIREQLQNVE